MNKAPGLLHLVRGPAPLFLLCSLLLNSSAQAEDDLKAAPVKMPTLSVSGTEPSNTAAPAAAGNAANAVQRKMPACLTAIAQAGRLEDVSLKSARLKEAIAEAVKLGPSSREDLRWIVENGSPCGRIYAVCLLKVFDRPEATEAAKALKEGMSDVNLEFVSASERCHYSIGDVLIDQSSAHPLIQLVPSSSVNYRTPRP
jgi:hypothetical protein